MAEYEPAKRYGARGVSGLFGPSVASRERKKRNDLAHKRGLDEQIKFRKQVDQNLAKKGPYGDFLVDKIASSPAPTRESNLVPPLHRTVDKGDIEPWVPWDELKYTTEQSRKLRWESFRDQNNLPQGEMGRSSTLPDGARPRSYYNRPLLPSAVSPLTHQTFGTVQRQRDGENDVVTNIWDRPDRSYDSPIWQIGEPNPHVSPIKPPNHLDAPTSISLDACQQVQRAFFAKDVDRQGLLFEEDIRQVCALFFIHNAQVENALRNAAGVKSMRDGRIRYNAFLKALCPQYFAADEGAADAGRGGRAALPAAQRHRREQPYWDPWGRSSGGGSPVRGPDGRPLADRSEMRRLAGYRIQDGGLRAMDTGLAEAPGAPMYLSASMGQFFRKDSSPAYVSPFTSSPVESAEHSKQHAENVDVEMARPIPRSRLNEHPISDFVSSGGAEEIPAHLRQTNTRDYRPGPVRVRRGPRRNRANSKPRENTVFIPGDVREGDSIMRKIIQSHDPLPEPVLIPASGAVDYEKSLLASIPSSEMSDFPTGLKLRGLSVSSSETSLDSEGREALLNKFSSASKPLGLGLAMNPGETSYERFISATENSIFERP